MKSRHEVEFAEAGSGAGPKKKNVPVQVRRVTRDIGYTPTDLVTHIQGLEKAFAAIREVLETESSEIALAYIRRIVEIVEKEV